MHLPLAEFIELQEKRISSAAVLIENSAGELLVVQASYKPYWSLPGGIIDSGESPREAAIREVYEEVGIQIAVDDIEFVSVIYRHSALTDTYSFVFRCTVPSAAAQPISIDDREIVATDWVSKADVKTRVKGDYNSAVDNWAADKPLPYIEERMDVDKVSADV